MLGREKGNRKGQVSTGGLHVVNPLNTFVNVLLLKLDGRS